MTVRCTLHMQEKSESGQRVQGMQVRFKVPVDDDRPGVSLCKSQSQCSPGRFR